MHGLIWEWVFDFNNNVLNADSRSKDSIDLNLFCGASSNAATNKEDYAAMLNCVKNHRQTTEAEDFEFAYDRIVMGVGRTNMFVSDKDKMITAVIL